MTQINQTAIFFTQMNEGAQEAADELVRVCKPGGTIGVLSWAMGSILAIPLTEGLNAALGTATMGTALTSSHAAAPTSAR